MGAQNYIMGGLIKSTETLTAAEIENPGIEGKKDEADESYETQIETKLVKIDMKTLVVTFLCPECTSQVGIKNVAAWWNDAKMCH